MNIQSFYEYVILRDILAFILPGGISLAGIYMIVYASGGERLEKIFPFLSNLDSTSQIVLFLLISFLIGHVWDTVYRNRYQTHKNFQRIEKIKEILIGNPAPEFKYVNNHIPNQIRSSVGQFLHINWKKTPIMEWIESGKAHDLSVLLSYWIEEEYPKIYSDEVARPNIQSHFLHVCGMAIRFFGFCVLIGVVLHLAGGVFSWSCVDALRGTFLGWLCVDTIPEPFLVLINPSLPLLILIPAALWFGNALIEQGKHKREILVEHVFRVFHVIWQKRVLEHEANLEIARHGGSLSKRNRSMKANP